MFLGHNVPAAPVRRVHYKTALRRASRLTQRARAALPRAGRRGATFLLIFGGRYRGGLRVELMSFFSQNLKKEAGYKARSRERDYRHQEI